jgi:hypothetical protein
MTIRGWLASSYYARTRNSAWTVASMLFLACAPSYTRAQAPAGARAVSQSSMTGAEILTGLRARGEARSAAEKALLAADAPLIEDILRAGSNRIGRELSVAAVSRIGPKAVPALLPLLDDEQLGPQAGRILFQVAGAESFARVPDLLSCLRGKPAVSRYCGDVLVKVCGPKAAAHTALLSGALADKDALVRTYAATALGRIGAPAKSAVPALVKALGDAESAVRLSAAAALGRMGAAARSAVPALKKAAIDPVPEVARAARAALRRTRG